MTDQIFSINHIVFSIYYILKPGTEFFFLLSTVYNLSKYFSRKPLKLKISMS